MALYFPVDEDGGGDESGDEEHDPRRLFLHRSRVRHVLEAVQGRLLFREGEREIERELDREREREWLTAESTVVDFSVLVVKC